MKFVWIFVTVMLVDKHRLTLAEENFQFSKPEDMNSIGIYPTVLALTEREVESTKDTWRINKQFANHETFEGLRLFCTTVDKNALAAWGDCTFDSEGMKGTFNHGYPADKNQTFAYLQVEFKAFTKSRADGTQEVCKLDEVYDDKVIFAVKTISNIPSNDTFTRDIVESVAVVHQHELDGFGPVVLSFFEDRLDLDAIYNFRHEEYYTRESPYECFLAIGSSQSVAVIEEKCSFFCLKKVDKSSPKYEEYKKMAEDDYYDPDTDHDEL